MRLTNKLYAQHLGWTFKKHWIAQSRRTPSDSGAAAELEHAGVTIKEVSDLSNSKLYFDQEKLENIVTKESVRRNEEYRNCRLKPCHVFSDNNLLLQGMEQAMLLTNSIEISRLPKSIQNSVESIQMNRLLERNIKGAIKASYLLCPDQVKLPKKTDHLRPEYNFPREYGLTMERRTSLLINKLLSECEKFAGRKISSQRRIIENLNFKVTVPKNDNLLQFRIKTQQFITSSRPLESTKCKYDAELPDIHPINHTISTPKEYIYSPETKYPFTNIMNHSHPHTIFIHFDKERVKNSFDVEVNISQFQSRNMLTAFCVAAARAKQLYGDSAFDDISSPIVVQSIQTDGKTFHFGIFQLNTLRLDELEGPKNYWFHMKNQDLFQQRGNASGTSVLEGFNMDVFRYVYAFYSNL